MSIYHTPINAAKEIRLLRLLPRASAPETADEIEGQVPIYCELYPITVDASKNGYEALSYQWGSWDNALSIYVNGIQKAVTQNLHFALQSFREENSEVILWVDAICINQEDDDEKGMQVNMMTDIYANARYTRVFLGPPDTTSDETMVDISHVGRAVIDRGIYELLIRMAVLGDGDQLFVQLEHEAAQLVEDMLENPLIQIDQLTSLFKRISEILSREYWSRLWILQEIVVSQNVELYCGRLKIEYAVLHAAVLYTIYMKTFLSKRLKEQLMEMLDSGDISSSQFCELEAQFDAINSTVISLPANLVLGIRHQYHVTLQGGGNPKVDLIRLLAKIRVGISVTVDKDRIYALLGMAADREILGINPDYADTTSCTSVYSNAAKAMIQSGHTDVLAFSQWTKEDHTVPSWVPDWREEVKQPFGQYHWNSPYSASGTRTFVPNMEQDVSSSFLKVNGFIVDFIESLKPQCNDGAWLSMSQRREACAYIQDIYTLCQTSNNKFEESGEEIYADNYLRSRAPQCVPVADLCCIQFTRKATFDECRLGHEEVIEDFIQRTSHGLSAGLPITNTLRSYYNVMAQQVERKPFITCKGFVGLAPKHAEAGDIVVVFSGAKFPYVIRKCDDEKYVLIGEAFVHGVMYGEWIEGREMKEFVLK
ncbi:heterokaryon incompatibility protein [Glarea lozoyensis ATCC 20868]|uniref:Heterokaryon incompatibility protein n=1 Tax=Glarea lozoyensis (strain ATCC 20868 / MF5171) TaxID=1116229 RepID=S3EA11_GLAL2|nr:heterokaryon incompatibility protein [Glarea lozoyensis ATCC 20868]EPE35168.1 heterokaryon incompatibility protein [Glarea lozoyensis ATCC 20868]